MSQDISAALFAFYGKVLEPEFRSMKDKLAGQDDKLARILDHVDALYQRFEKLEEEYRLIFHGM